MTPADLAAVETEAKRIYASAGWNPYTETRRDGWSSWDRIKEREHDYWRGRACVALGKEIE